MIARSIHGPGSLISRAFRSRGVKHLAWNNNLARRGSGATIRHAAQQRFPLHIEAARAGCGGGSSNSFPRGFVRAAAAFSTIAFAAAISARYTMEKEASSSTTTTKCEVKSPNVMATMTTDSPTSASFQMMAALEVKEEMQKIKVARFLRDLTTLAKETRKNLIRRQSRAILRDAEEEDEEGVISLRGLDLSNLSPEKAQYILDAFQEGFKLEPLSLIDLARACIATVKEDPTVVDLRGVQENVTVVGDLHGSLYCLLKVLQITGDLSRGGKVVFLGDYVDRGEHSLEVFFTILLLKLAYPDKVFLLRGNHEDTMISSVYGFLDEVKVKYPKHWEKIWDNLAHLFAALPICARSDTAFLVHGGLPSADFSLSDIESISGEERSKLATIIDGRDDKERLLESILWSDPSPNDGIEPNPRGAGIAFGPDVARQFLDRHGLKFIIRGHEPAEYGTQIIECGEGCGVVTVFSTAGYPNGEGTNSGAIVILDPDGGIQSIIFERSSVDDEEEDVHPCTTAAAATQKHPYAEALKTAVAENSGELREVFQSIEREDGLITVTEWADIMGDTLDLADMPWTALQPSLAPATEPQGEKIDWRQFLEQNASLCLNSISKDQLVILEENQDKLLNIFQFLDADGSGEIDMEEFLSGVEILNRSHLEKNSQLKNPKELFRMLDLDGNGVIDIEEFSEAVSNSAVFGNLANKLQGDQVNLLKQNHDMLLTVFKFLDTDGNGSIDRNEFRVGVELLNERLEDDKKFQDPDELFSVLDIDGSGEIDINEFHKIFQAI